MTNKEKTQQQPVQGVANVASVASIATARSMATNIATILVPNVEGWEVQMKRVLNEDTLMENVCLRLKYDCRVSRWNEFSPADFKTKDQNCAFDSLFLNCAGGISETKLADIRHALIEARATLKLTYLSTNTPIMQLANDICEFAQLCIGMPAEKIPEPLKDSKGNLGIFENAGKLYIKTTGLKYILDELGAGWEARTAAKQLALEGFIEPPIGLSKCNGLAQEMRHMGARDRYYVFQLETKEDQPPVPDASEDAAGIGDAKEVTSDAT